MSNNNVFRLLPKASTSLDMYAHMVSGIQEKAAAVMDEITTPVSLPAGLLPKAGVFSTNCTENRVLKDVRSGEFNSNVK